MDRFKNDFLKPTRSTCIIGSLESNGLIIQTLALLDSTLAIFLGRLLKPKAKKIILSDKNSSSLKNQEIPWKNSSFNGTCGENHCDSSWTNQSISVGNTQLDLIFWDKKVLTQTGLQKHQGEFIRLQGKITQYHNKKRDSTSYQIHVYSPAQIVLSPPLPS